MPREITLNTLGAFNAARTRRGRISPRVFIPRKWNESERSWRHSQSQLREAGRRSLDCSGRPEGERPAVRSLAGQRWRRPSRAEEVTKPTPSSLRPTTAPCNKLRFACSFNCFLEVFIRNRIHWRNFFLFFGSKTQKYDCFEGRRQTFNFNFNFSFSPISRY